MDDFIKSTLEILSKSDSLSHHSSDEIKTIAKTYMKKVTTINKLQYEIKELVEEQYEKIYDYVFHGPETQIILSLSFPNDNFRSPVRVYLFRDVYFVRATDFPDTGPFKSIEDVFKHNEILYADYIYEGCVEISSTKSVPLHFLEMICKSLGNAELVLKIEELEYNFDVAESVTLSSLETLKSS